MLDGISQCWWLSKDCVPRWEAWAVAAALFGAIGSWGAAWATFYAVILPIRRRKLEDKAVASSAIEHFADELIELRGRMGIASLTLARLKPTTYREHANSMVRALGRHTATVPVLTATPETLPLANALNGLRRALAKWSRTVATFDLSQDPDLPVEFLDFVIEGLRSDHSAVMTQIRAVAALARDILPAYAVELDRIINSGDGFLPYAFPQD